MTDKSDCPAQPSVLRVAQPSSAASSIAFWSQLLGSAHAQQRAPFPDKERLSALRRGVVENLEKLRHRFERSIAARPEILLHGAADATSVADGIAALCGPAGSVAINRSGTVANELVSELERRGLQVRDSYAAAARGASAARARPWERPEPKPELNAAAFALADHACTRQTLRNVVAVIGVSVASAEDGGIYLLQHFANISALLDSAAIVALVVPLEKIVADAAQAEEQIAAMAGYGIDAVLAELRVRGSSAERKPSEGAGAGDQAAQTVHVFLLDNGRSVIARDPAGELLGCIGCRACITRCPTQPFFGGAGRQNPREYALGRLAGRNSDVDYCVLCSMCYAVCPVGINIPRHLAAARAEDARVKGFSAQRALLGNPDIVGALTAPFAQLANLTFDSSLLRGALEKVAGIARERPLPRYARQTFAAWMRSRSGDAKRAGGRRVVYFAGCYANYNRPDIGRAAVQVLARSGVDVAYPPQGCCGIPQLANGQATRAVALARRTIDALSAELEQGSDVVTTCTTCYFTLTKVYRDLLGKEADVLARRTRDLSEYLVAMGKRGELDIGGLSPLQMRVAYHTPCHARAGGIDGSALELMRLIPGLEVVEIDRGCCGLSGTFGMKRQHYTQSMQIGAPVFERVAALQPDCVSTDCPTCTMQLEHGTARELQHPLLLLARAYERETAHG